jgi:Tol biopolymer transport system component
LFRQSKLENTHIVNNQSTYRLGLFPIILLIALAFLLGACKDDSQPTEESESPGAPVNAYPEPGEGVVDGYPAPGYPAPGYPGPGDAGDLVPEIVEPIPQFPGVLAFHSNRSGPLQIFMMDGASGTVEPFVDMPSQAFEPSWAPDCQRIAFSSGPGGVEGFDIYTIAGVGQEARPLAADPDLLEWAAAWSPSGDVIAFQNNAGNLINVCFVDSQGSDLGCLERGSFSNAMPAWSPDGTKLAFGSNRDGDWDIFLTDYPPTEEISRLTDNPEIDFYPEFSPNGESIAYAAQRLGNFEIATVNLDGTGELWLTDEAADDTKPTWVGDDLIAFSSFRTDAWELYLMNADGSDVKRLTYQKAADQWPAWCLVE